MQFTVIMEGLFSTSFLARVNYETKECKLNFNLRLKQGHSAGPTPAPATLNYGGVAQLAEAVLVRLRLSLQVDNPDGQSSNREQSTNNHIDASAIPAPSSWAEN